MEQYISKSALVAEIERLKANALQKKEQCKRRGLEKIMHQIGAYNKVISLINALEVKEVDLNKEIESQWNKFVDSEGEVEQFSEIAKHFFELGLKAAQKGE